MIFLIEYDRRDGELKTFERFADDQRKDASSRRLALEIELTGKRISREVVLLEAATEELLRQTHSRYFKRYSEIAKLDPLKIPEFRAGDRSAQ
ncbi:MAG: hypothetical protein KDJ14_11020 [Xanthomonadales bacterium]|nr:hypothetical protein [Xanthomonadales bacterium]